MAELEYGLKELLQLEILIDGRKIFIDPPSAAAIMPELATDKRITNTEMVAVVANAVRQQYGNIKALTAKVEENKKNIDRTTKELTVRIDGIDKKLAANVENIAGLRADVEAQIARYDTQLAALVARDAQLTEAIEQSGGLVVGGSNEEDDAISRELQDLQTVVGEVQIELLQLQDDISDLKNG